MKIEVLGKSYAEAIVDLNGFMKELRRSWDLERAIKANTKISRIKHKQVNEKDLKQLIWCCMDWSELIDYLKETIENEIKIKFFFIRYTDWKRLYPGIIKDNEIEMFEQNESGHSTLIVQSLIKNLNFDIKAFLKQGCFMYASTDKVKVGWLNRDGNLQKD